MKRALLGLVATLALAGVARADGTSVALANTTGAVVFFVDGAPEMIEFVSTHGQVALVPVDVCSANDTCVALVTALGHAHKVQRVDLKAPEHV